MAVWLCIKIKKEHLHGYNHAQKVLHYLSILCLAQGNTINWIRINFSKSLIDVHVKQKKWQNWLYISVLLIINILEKLLIPTTFLNFHTQRRLRFPLIFEGRSKKHY